MDNVVLTSASQISPQAGHPLSTEIPPPEASEPMFSPTAESDVAAPAEPAEPSQVDGNLQAHMDVNYQAHDVALATAKATEHEKTNGHEQTNGFKLGEHHQMEIDDGFEHPDKVKSCCSMLNKLFLALAIVCFALFLCSIAFIVANLEGLNGKQDGRGLSRIAYPYPIADPFASSERLMNDLYFNLTHPNRNGMVVVLARRGAAIHDVLIPIVDNGVQRYRSIVLKGDNRTHFGSVRFGFEDEFNSGDMVNQLPKDYPFLNFYDRHWPMYADSNKPNRVRFVLDSVEVVYEFSSSSINELIMTTIVSAPAHQPIVADPSNNIYFNLRGYGNMSTHSLNMSSAIRINDRTGEQLVQNQSYYSASLNQFNGLKNYFYKLDHAGIGKNYVATLTESQTKMSVQMFADHAGVIIDPSGVIVPGTHGMRISPRQSPVYHSKAPYGPTQVIRPSQAMHTTWWQFEY